MTNAAIAVVRTLVAACLLAGPAAAAPRMGQVSISPGVGAALVSNRDIKDAYGPSLTATSSPVAAAIGAGIDYNLSDSFQMGARYDRILKKYDVDLVSGGSSVGKDTWNVDANALLLHARFIIKGRTPASWFALSFLVGQYALSGAGLKTVLNNGSSASAELSGKATGGEADVEMERAFGEQVTGVFMLGWRVAAVKKVTYTTPSRTGTLLNDDNSDARLDLGGLNAGIALRFYFGGQGASVTSE